jgi:nucleotide-binding universal stress UspA family protein
MGPVQACRSVAPKIGDRGAGYAAGDVPLLRGCCPAMSEAPGSRVLARCSDRNDGEQDRPWGSPVIWSAKMYPCPDQFSLRRTPPRQLITRSNGQHNSQQHSVRTSMRSVLFQTSLSVPQVSGPGTDVIIHSVEIVRAEHAEALSQAMIIGRSAGVEVHEHLAQGEPAAQIASVADEIGADLIVIGSRGLDPAGRYVLGSVPERVVFDPHGHDVCVVRTT